MATPATLPDIVCLNVGGTRFSTSYQTLTWIPDSFFTSLLSGRIPSLKDSRGDIFIDRDPILFSHILNYLRTREFNFSTNDTKGLKHEAEFFGLTPLVRRLMLCDELQQKSCGGILFHGIIYPQYSSVSSSSEDGLEIDQAVLQNAKVRLGHGTHSESKVCATSKSMEFAALQTSFLERYPMRVTIVKGHCNWLAVSYPHFICLYRLKESLGWKVSWVSSRINAVIERVAVNAKHLLQDGYCRVVAISYGCVIQLWQIYDNRQNSKDIGIFNLGVQVNSLFFIGSHLVALSNTGKFGIWHATTQNWQVQDIVPITSHDTTGSLLLLGCDNGCIFVIDVQKFPLRMKDNDLLVTELYKDPAGDKITSLSVYLTPKTNQFVGFGGNWMEIAYGTNSGVVRIIVQHPETLGQGPQLFQTFTVHCSPVTKVMISEKHLVSVCSELNHVRTWTVTRFRGMINTQPGSMPLASFNVFNIEEPSPPCYYSSANDFGPYGEKDDMQVFIQKVAPESDQLIVRFSSSGERVCVIKSVDGSMISSFIVHECEGSNRMGSRPRRFIFTGHTNGTVQIWDLSTAFELPNKGCEEDLAGLTGKELMDLIDHCDLTNSRSTTPAPTPLVTSLSNLHLSSTKSNNSSTTQVQPLPNESTKIPTSSC